MKSQRFLLPGGLCLDSNKCYRDVQLRQIIGKDEELIATDSNTKKNLLTVITFLLIRCTERIGPITELTEDIIRKLLIADRDYLVLKLRQITFGNKIKSIVTCPNHACGKMMDIDFDLDNISVNEKDIGNGIFTCKLSDNAAYCVGNDKHDVVEFRLPNIGDLEYVSEIARENHARATTILLTKCIKKLGKISEITEDLASSLSLLARKEIEEAMKNLSPSVNLEMELQCPECEHIFSTSFDMYRFLLMK